MRDNEKDLRSVNLRRLRRRCRGSFEWRKDVRFVDASLQMASGRKARLDSSTPPSHNANARSPDSAIKISPKLTSSSEISGLVANLEVKHG